MSVIPTLEEVSDLNREIQVKSMLLDLISEIDPGTKRGLQLSERGTKVAKRMIELDLPPYVVPPKLTPMGQRRSTSARRSPTV